MAWTEVQVGEQAGQGNISRRKLTTLHRAELRRRRGMKRAQKHASFIMNPFKFTIPINLWEAS